MKERIRQTTWDHNRNHAWVVRHSATGAFPILLYCRQKQKTALPLFYHHHHHRRIPAPHRVFNQTLMTCVCLNVHSQTIYSGHIYIYIRVPENHRETIWRFHLYRVPVLLSAGRNYVELSRTISIHMWPCGRVYFQKVTFFFPFFFQLYIFLFFFFYSYYYAPTRNSIYIYTIYTHLHVAIYIYIVYIYATKK